VERAIADAFREEWPRLVALLIGRYGDWDLAEECAQEAFALAWRSWSSDGIPDRPAAWLTTAARRRVIDRLRHRRMVQEKLPSLAEPSADGDELDLDALDSGIDDQLLRLIFTCCHPALAPESRVALTLHTLLGLGTTEIARAFGASESATARRLTRARTKIRLAGIPYRVPPAHLLGERTASVLSVIHLLAGEGYVGTTSEELGRSDVSAEALRLSALLARLMPDEPEVLGLHALLLFHRSRAATRVDDAGTLIPLEEQDRSRWSASLINSAFTVLGRAARLDRLGPYQVQAMIAACHLTARRYEDTDWDRIVGLYRTLLTMLPAPTVRLNLIIATAMRSGPRDGLALVEEFRRSPEAAALPAPHLLPATRADLLRRLGRPAEAALDYRRALELTANGGERRYLQRRLQECSAGITPRP
jgi:RNA polymerase sigma-70 factor (ECF subfamily)